MKISAVYKITNTITGDFYIGSSKNVKERWAHHKIPSRWKQCPNNPMYIDMRQYGVDKFVFEVLAEVEVDSLKETEQEFIETLKPTYNNYNANGFDVERYKEYKKEYRKTDKYKKAQKQYQKTDKYKKYKKQYHNQLCSYNGETLTLVALCSRFRRAGVEHPTQEAKKYLIKKESKNAIEFYDIYP